MLEINPNLHPSNSESEEHFLLKQVARAILKTRFHCNIIATEVHTGNHAYPELKNDYSGYQWSRRKVTDAIGVQNDSRTNNKDLVRNIEVKVSKGDLKGGYCLSGNYNYILAPKDVVSKDLLFPFVGLIEVNLNNLVWKKDKRSGMAKDIKGVDITKNPRKCKYGKHHSYWGSWMNYIKEKIAKNIVNDAVYRNNWFYPGFDYRK